MHGVTKVLIIHIYDAEVCTGDAHTQISPFEIHQILLLSQVLRARFNIQNLSIVMSGQVA